MVYITISYKFCMLIKSYLLDVDPLPSRDSKDTRKFKSLENALILEMYRIVIFLFV